MKNYETATDIVTLMLIASAGFNIVAVRRNNIKLAAIGLGLYFGSAIVSAITTARIMSEN